MATISDLSQDLIEEILSRVSVTSGGKVRSTCKGWNVLSNDQRFIEKHCRILAAKEPLAIMLYDDKAYVLNVNLHNDKDLVEPYLKEIGNFSSQVEISQLFHCDGLLLCVTKCDNSDLTRPMVCNPYLGQVRWIQPVNKLDMTYRYVLGYDNNNNHKILKYPCDSKYYYTVLNQTVYEIYDFKSNSWKVLKDTPAWNIYGQGVSLKGNTYFHDNSSLVCFDFTLEKFGLGLRRPFLSGTGDILLSTIKEEHLALLLPNYLRKTIEIWITTKIDPSEISWRTFLKLDMEPSHGMSHFRGAIFFVDEKKKAAVICYADRDNGAANKAYMIGEHGYYKSMDLRESSLWAMGCSYVPSTVQIQVQ